MWLDGLAVQFWGEIYDLLSPMAFVTEAERPALTLLAIKLAQIRDAYEHVQAEGSVTVDKLSVKRISPYVKILDTATESVLRILDRFGMTPSSRSKIVARAKGEEDEFEKFLRERAS